MESLKPLKNILGSSLILIGLFAALNSLQAQEEATATMLQAVEATTPVDAAEAPEFGTFYSAQNPDSAPAPANVNGVPVWPIGDGFYLLDDLENTSRTTALSRGGMQAMSMDPNDPGDGSDTNTYTPNSSPMYVVPTNGLWLQITNVANGLAYVNLNNATNLVYEIWSKTDLSLTNWSIEQEVWPTNGTVMPFIVSQWNRTNLFLWAQDWTGITSNGNSTPDWWFWKYFGTLTLSETNLDSQGNTLLSDYQNGLDPNVISFALQFTNEYVNSMSANGTLAILGGVPSYRAVLVNDTNLADANWQPYTSSNLTVFLGTSDGSYTVNIGLRGLPADAQPTWQTVELTLDTVPPVLAITNPVVGGTVSVPMIQLQGLVNESLGSLTFEISNALQVLTNQQGYWQPIFYDTNRLVFTTNRFQCYDLALTNGVNTITIHATDLAGNVTTTNFNCTLDYSGDTTAPTLNLIWPQANAAISGSNFTLQAMLDDATTKVVASITDTNNDTNVITALVERNGNVWVDNLPLAAGTNTVTLTATDAAGNVNTTSFNVIQSPLNLTVNPISSDQLNQSSVSVTGTVSPGQNVWVNGIQASVDGSGNWTVDNVPVNPSGTASLNVQAGADLGSVIGSQLFNQVQPAHIGLMSYLYKRAINTTGLNNAWTIDWNFLSGGDESKSSSALGLWFYQLFPAGDDGSGSWTWEKYSISWVPFGEGTGKESAEATVMIEPPGQQSGGGTSLYLVSASVMEFSDPLAMDLSYGGDVPLPPERLQINHQTLINSGITNGDGSVSGLILVSAPAGVPCPLALTAPSPAYSFNIKVLKTKEDWQSDVRQEINQDSGYTAIISQYLASNGFNIQNRKNIQGVYAFYQKMYLEQPTEYYWCGLAKLAGAPVYAALSDAQHAAPLLYNFQDTLVQMNINILNDLAWQFEAYRKGGLNALQEIYAVDKSALDSDDINAWQEIDQGIQQNNQALILEGNEALLQREQQQVLASGYLQLSTMDAGVIASYMSILAQCPVWDPSTSEPYAGRGFYAIVPGGNLTTYNDRWTWITYPTGGIWDTWVNLLLTDKTSQVSLDLRTRANTYANLPLY